METTWTTFTVISRAELEEFFAKRPAAVRFQLMTVTATDGPATVDIRSELDDDKWQPLKTARVTSEAFDA